MKLGRGLGMNIAAQDGPAPGRGLRAPARGSQAPQVQVPQQLPEELGVLCIISYCMMSYHIILYVIA